MLITTAGAFTAFSLMTIAVGTDYWLYSPGVCRTESTGDNETSQKNEEVLTHSGLWRQCCMEGKHKTTFRTRGLLHVCRNKAFYFCQENPLALVERAPLTENVLLFNLFNQYLLALKVINCTT